MLAKIFRFHGYGSLKFVYQKGRMARSRLISLKYLPNTRRTQSRLAVVVSKKVTKKAPVRNRIRRRVYEVARAEWPNLRHPQDMVITVFDDRISKLTSAEVTQLVQDLFRQANLYE
ncbi:MAG: ribonuclease P protein component [Candidatus Saccharimonadales bacterium]